MRWNNSVSNAFHKICDIVEELGWWNTVLYLVRKSLHSISPNLNLYKYYIIAQPVPENSLLANRHSAINVCPVAEQEYNFDWFPRPAENIRERYRQGAICLVAFKGEDAIGCLWLQLGPFIEDEVRCCFIPLPSNSAAWDFDVYVQPSHRIGRAFAYLWEAANERLRQAGIQWTMSRIDAFNPTSIQVHQRLGAQKIASAIFLCFGAYQLLFANISPYIHLSSRLGHFPKMPISSPTSSAAK